ncbi:ABC transporter substrate-binding protein [Pseudogemmobacter humi]|uniref:Glutathione-binding protein GsiB n=1 Tax=Pseudogemmobacter humi TaxID=2483812 RepID=A0A3P5X2A0_9RHOB|nr:ABC transporter substrate-binding protein [Pseudogemmobacter humi]VDC22367.1 Glutathione-binding protein GsiB precursor [Pseudogemmobacter humi]
MTINRRNLLLSGAACTGASVFGFASLDEAFAQATGRLTVCLYPEPPSLMLGLTQTTPAFIVAGKIYQGLLTYDFDLNPQPGLAKEWSVSEDGLTYTFRLQENVRWHDGAPFTAHDVVFSTQECLPEIHSRARANFASVESATALDDHTVEYRLKTPFTAFLQVFEASGAPILPAHIYKGTDYRTNPANESPIGTGPFRLKEWRRGEYIHLVRNEDYYKEDLPLLNEIYFQIIPDSASRLVALQNGTVDVTGYDNIDYVFMPAIRESADFGITHDGYQFAAPLATLEFNTRSGHVADKRFRKAMLHAIDRDFIIENIWFGQAAPATGLVSSPTRYYKDTGPLYPYDPGQATALLDEMGLQPDANGVRASVKLLGIPYGDMWTKLGEYVKQSLSQVGIDIQIENTDPGNWASRYSNWEFETTFCFWYQFGHPGLGITRLYHSSSIAKGIYGSNTAGYENPEVDRLFDEAIREIDEEKRAAMYGRLQEILIEDLPNAPLFEIKWATVMRKGVKNVVTTAIGICEGFETATVE